MAPSTALDAAPKSSVEVGVMAIFAMVVMGAAKTLRADQSRSCLCRKAENSASDVLICATTSATVSILADVCVAKRDGPFPVSRAYSSTASFLHHG